MVKRGMPRTSNQAESWHRQIKNLVHASHKEIRALVVFLQNELCSNIDTLDYVESGIGWPVREKKKIGER